MITIFLLATLAYGKPVSIIDGNKLTVAEWVIVKEDFDWRNCNQMIIGDIAAFAAWNHFTTLHNHLQIKRRVIITSCYRPHGKLTSQHLLGNAVDFHLEYITDNPTKEYAEDYLNYVLFFDSIDRLENVGDGLYPYKRFFHRDHRGHRAAWSEDEDGNEISMLEGLFILNELIKE